MYRKTEPFWVDSNGRAIPKVSQDPLRFFKAKLTREVRTHDLTVENERLKNEVNRLADENQALRMMLTSSEKRKEQYYEMLLKKFPDPQ